jgi:hypothetical protein
MNNPAVSLALTGVVPSVCDAEAGACPDDRVAAGAHIVTPRAPYDHRGIYVGNGVLVHYAGHGDRDLRSP